MSARKKSPIALPEEGRAVQSGLFTTPHVLDQWYPKVKNDETTFNHILDNITDPYIGLDFEFPPSYKASVIGISHKDLACAIPATPENVTRMVQRCVGNGIRMIGHSVHGAEKEVIATTCGLDIPIEHFEDSMLSHYLLNADFAKSPEKGEVDDKGALGFMGLWTAASMVLSWPNWKWCRGQDCEGMYCPTHDVMGYCALDAAASERAFRAHLQDFERQKVPRKLYDELKELTNIATVMQRQGVRVDMGFVRNIDKKADEYKATLFNTASEFNPRAPGQVVDWFRANGVQLAGNDKPSVRKTLEKYAAKYGYSTHDEDGKFSLIALEEAPTLPKELDALYRLYEYKSAGKGLAPWFGDKYITEHDGRAFVNPRWITIGASTGRWSSSRPNWTNVPARGFGSLVMAAIIPRDESLDFVHADASNLELRIVIYLGGYDPSIVIPGDPFTTLVNNSGGAFELAASWAADTPRGVAKTVSHASSYLEGIKVLNGRDLSKPNIKHEIEAGALRVFKDWEYRGGIVAFTGANLAERLFGSKTYENRKRALDIQHDVYFRAFPMIPAWHRKVLREIEGTGRVTYPTGHFLRLYGSPEDDAKMGAAALGQGVGAAHVQGLLLRFVRETARYPIMFVHDSLKFEIPREWSDARAKEFIDILGQESDRLPGLKTPYKSSRGGCGLEYDAKKPATHIEGAMRPLNH